MKIWKFSQNFQDHWGKNFGYVMFLEKQIQKNNGKHVVMCDV